ncbi:hypothetical protein ABR32_18635 [Enterobacter cloacae subsp. dissolvens]|nr:hypothetical protein [Escherichia coli]EFN9130248.1 hypothetical protein [Escherichia coli]EFN9597294.1 hypothetical protein [Escherichia coli]KLQ37517.1 hypothetical protein ABR32_18635 [Enterobacter cloacae subsp. dissolvens]
MATFHKLQKPRQSARERSVRGKNSGNKMVIVAEKYHAMSRHVTTSHAYVTMSHDMSRQIKIKI